MIIDTGAESSVVRISALTDQLNVQSNDTVQFSGIAQGKVESLGSLQLDIIVNEHKFTHPFQVVPANFPISCDVLIGADFLLRFDYNLSGHRLSLCADSDNDIETHYPNALFSNEKQSLTHGCTDFNVSLGNLFETNEVRIGLMITTSNTEAKIHIPPRTECVLAVQLETENDMLCTARITKEGLIVGNSLMRAVNGVAAIGILNPTSKPIVCDSLDLEVHDMRLFSIVREVNVSQENRVDKILDLVSLNGFNEPEKESVLRSIRQYADLFHLKDDVLTYCDAVRHTIPVFEDTAPINVRPYRLPIAQRGVIQEQIGKMLKDGIIRSSRSAWNAPLLIVPKKSQNGVKKWRIVVDFRKLNDVTIGDSFPLPNITDILDQLGQSKYFSTLDLASGYHQVLMDSNDAEKTAFSTGFNHFEWVRMPMGLKSAGHTFQRLMNSVMTGLNGISCFVYLDDLVIYAKDIEDHEIKLNRVFERLREFNLKLQPEKCIFLRKEVVYLGHLITKDGIKPDPSKIDPIRNFPRPNNARAIKSFLGMIGYYRRFIPNFAEIAKPLTLLLKKSSKFVWNQSADAAFAELRQMICQPPILQYPQFDKTFIITTDASKEAISAVLSQGEIGNDLPIAFASRTLIDAETRYSATELELLAIVWGVEYFRPYVYGRKFIIFTDHKPLCWVMQVKEPNSRLIRWKLRLSSYDFTIVYKAGKANCVADCLSRYITTSSGVDLMIMTRAASRKQEENAMVDNTVGDSKEISIFESSDRNLLKLHNTQITFINKDDIISKVGRVVSMYIPGFSTDVEVIMDALTKLQVFLESHGLTHVYIKRKELHDNLKLYEQFKEHWRHIFDGKVKCLIFTESAVELTDRTIIEQVLKDFHFAPLGGHQGFARTRERIRQYYFWQGMSKDIRDTISCCDICSRNKHQIPTKMPMQITTTAKRPFERVALDIVGPLPESLEGYQYLLTFQDDLSKFVGAVPIKNQDADTVARAFVKHVVLRFGIPESVLTDQGSNFLSDLFKRVCKLLKIKKYASTAYHPQTNGALERSHRTMKEYLRSFIDANLSDWSEIIDFGIFTMNTSVNQSTQYTPFELLYGFKCEIPHSVRKPPEPLYNYDNYACELRYRLQKAHEIARINQLSAKERSKKYVDKRMNSEAFDVGDEVFLKSEKQKGEGRKLQALYDGPFEVVGIVSDVNTEINIGRKTVVVHNNRLKKKKV